MQAKFHAVAQQCSKRCVGVLLAWPCIGWAIDIPTDNPDLTMKWDTTV